jgi:hypothetical protein
MRSAWLKTRKKKLLLFVHEKTMMVSDIRIDEKGMTVVTFFFPQRLKR